MFKPTVDRDIATEQNPGLYFTTPMAAGSIIKLLFFSPDKSLVSLVFVCFLPGKLVAVGSVTAHLFPKILGLPQEALGL